MLDKPCVNLSVYTNQSQKQWVVIYTTFNALALYSFDVNPCVYINSLYNQYLATSLSIVSELNAAAQKNQYVYLLGVKAKHCKNTECSTNHTV